MYTFKTGEEMRKEAEEDELGKTLIKIKDRKVCGLAEVSKITSRNARNKYYLDNKTKYTHSPRTVMECFILVSINNIYIYNSVILFKKNIFFRSATSTMDWICGR